MEINTKFDLGQKVWAMRNGEPLRCKITDIFISRFPDSNNTELCYRVCFDEIWESDESKEFRRENRLANTREELLSRMIS